jgi:hypothetical protein
MKKQKSTFATQYPYLSYWVKNGGYMQLGHNENAPDDTFLMLTDEDDIIYDAEEDGTIDEVLQKAENYLREVNFPDRFDEETIEALETIYAERG